MYKTCYYSQVYIVSVISIGVLIFIWVVCFWDLFVLLSFVRYLYGIILCISVAEKDTIYSKHLLKKINPKPLEQWKLNAHLFFHWFLAVIPTSFSICTWEKNRTFSGYFWFSVLINKVAKYCCIAFYNFHAYSMPHKLVIIKKELIKKDIF